MDKKTLAIVGLSVSGTLLFCVNFISPRTAEADSVAIGRDYQAVTTRAQVGGESLYILDNKTGQIAVFLYDPKDKTVRVRDVRYVSDAFAGR